MARLCQSPRSADESDGPCSADWLRGGGGFRSKAAITTPASTPGFRPRRAHGGSTLGYDCLSHAYYRSRRDANCYCAKIWLEGPKFDGRQSTDGCPKIATRPNAFGPCSVRHLLI